MVTGFIKDLVGFGFGVYLAIPSDANIGYAFVNFLTETARASQSFITMSPIFKIAVSLAGLYIAVYSLAMIGKQVREGTFV